MTPSGIAPHPAAVETTTIATVLVDDIQEVFALMEWTVATAVDAPPAARAAFVANVQANVERWAAAPALSIHLKCVDHGSLVGMVLVRDYWNLCALFVAPTHHRRGIGSALVREAIARYREKTVRPWIRLNAALNAVAFYRALGFCEMEDAVPVMSAVPMELVL